MADVLRGPFEQDRHRIISCTAFRRLEHKTQVFAPGLHDHFRTRLTHTLEVAQISRCLARHLEADLDLCEAIALAHDLGHPPFGHAGEAALNELMRPHSGFNHNTHSLRVVEFLEHPYPSFRGLNLTTATLDGLRAHATKYDSPGDGDAGGASLEAQIVSLADRMAYNLHDLEDAIGADLIQLDELGELTLWKESFESATRDVANSHLHAIRRPALDAILDRLLGDAVAASRKTATFADSAEFPGAVTKPVVRLSTEGEVRLSELEEFLADRVYRNRVVAAADEQGQRTIRQLFDAYLQNPNSLPSRFSARIPDQSSHRVICDYIAGMTDRYCIAEHDRVVSNSA